MRNRSTQPAIPEGSPVLKVSTEIIHLLFMNNSIFWPAFSIRGLMNLFSMKNLVEFAFGGFTII